MLQMVTILYIYYLQILLAYYEKKKKTLLPEAICPHLRANI